jgi:hypothetical protein
MLEGGLLNVATMEESWTQDIEKPLATPLDTTPVTPIISKCVSLTKSL